MSMERSRDASRGGGLLKTDWVLLAAMTLPMAFMPGCKKGAAPEPEVTVQASHLEQGAIAERMTADAILAPLAQAAIAPKISAPVRRFYVERGSRVKAGQLLATLENSDLTAAEEDNKGSYAAAEAAYATTTKAQVPEETQKAELDAAQAKANLDLNLSIVKSRKQLFAEGAIPGRDLDTAKAALVQAQAAYDAAAKHLESMRSVSREAALKAAQGQLDSAEGKYKGAEAQVSYSEIRSPIDGVVTDRPLYAGETAAAGAPVITVMETSSLLAKAHVAQNLAQHMKLGDDGIGACAGSGWGHPRQSRVHKSGARPRQHDRGGVAQDRQQGGNAQGRHASQSFHHGKNRSKGMEDSCRRDSGRAGRQQVRDGSRRGRDGTPEAGDARHCGCL